MARDESDREDLIREATALVERIELVVDGFDEPIVAGFRRDGAASFYFGQQRVYQFNAAGQLRRGYVDGRLYKAEHGRLAQLTRERTAETVNLLRHDLSGEETSRFLFAAREQLRKLHAALSANQFRVIGQVPTNGDVTSRVCAWLAELSDCIPIAGSAGIA